MAYAKELDDLRQELRKDTAGTIVFWPKVDGKNVQVETDGTFEVFDNNGDSIQGPTSIDGTLINSEVDRYDVSVNAIGTLAEEYYVKILWEEAGTSFQRQAIVPFDVVATPMYGPSVSLNDLLEERPDVGETLDRIGERLGYTVGTDAREEAAGIYAVRALVEVDNMLRSTINDTAARQVATPTGTSGSIDRLHAIFNRELLNRVERKVAMWLIYQADRDPEESEFWEMQAKQAWRALPPLRFDTTGDIVPDTTVDDVGRVIRQRRVQA